MGEKRGEQGGVRRYFAVDAAGSIAWRAEELVEREASRVRDREEWRIGKNRGVCVCACVVRVRVTGYEREREREGGRGMHRDGVGERKTVRQRATPLPPPLSLPLSLSTLSSRSIHHHPYHRPTTPGVDASRVVATGSERSMPSMRSLPLSVSPFHFVPLCNSFLLPSSSSCRLEPLLLDLPSHAHASIRDNKRVYTRRRWSTSPRLNVFMHTGGGGVCVRSLSETRE